MPKRQNCWEYKGCGREPGGSSAESLGLCPAATETRLDGANGGKNGGRACWFVAGTFCDGQPQGTFVAKAGDCLKCDFFEKVIREEGSAYEAMSDLEARMLH